MFILFTVWFHSCLINMRKKTNSVENNLFLTRHGSPLEFLSVKSETQQGFCQRLHRRCFIPTRKVHHQEDGRQTVTQRLMGNRTYLCLCLCLMWLRTKSHPGLLRRVKSHEEDNRCSSAVYTKSSWQCLSSLFRPNHSGGGGVRLQWIVPFSV